MTDDYELIEPDDRSMFQGFLELMRLPNIFTAMADAIMGFLFVRGDADLADWWVLGLLLPASSLLYVGGVVLNDVVDRNLDAVERPSRPLPSGRVSLRAASIASGILLLAGIAFGWSASLAIGSLRPGLIATLLLLCILIYNGLLKTTCLGPPTMGSCRMLNVLLGMSVGGAYLAENWLVAGGIGLYIAGVTWFARTEAERSNRGILAAAAVVMLLGIALIAWVPRWSDRALPFVLNQPSGWYSLIAAMALMIGWRVVVAIAKPEPVWVQRAVSHAVLSLIMLDAAACYVIRGPYWSAAILLLMMPAMFISRKISPT